MFEDFAVHNFTPVSAFAGGLLIGLAALWITCIAGVSILWASVVAIRLLDARHPAPATSSTATRGRAL